MRSKNDENYELKRYKKYILVEKIFLYISTATVFFVLPLTIILCALIKELQTLFILIFLNFLSFNYGFYFCVRAKLNLREVNFIRYHFENLTWSDLVNNLSHKKVRNNQFCVAEAKNTYEFLIEMYRFTEFDCKTFMIMKNQFRDQCKYGRFKVEIIYIKDKEAADVRIFLEGDDSLLKEGTMRCYFDPTRNDLFIPYYQRKRPHPLEAIYYEKMMDYILDHFKIQKSRICNDEEVAIYFELH